MAPEKRSQTKKQARYIEDFIVSRLVKINLKPWQEVCKSLAPPHYDNITRSKWFDDNKFRANIGRDIVEFVDEMISVLQDDDNLAKVRVSDIRSAVVKGVRKAEKEQDITKYLLNDVKFATLRTIVGWVDHPERVTDERSVGMKTTRRGRKKEKGKHLPPQIDIVKEWEIVSNDSIRITSAISNNYLHPYQNVELKMDFGPQLVVTSVTPFSWLPDERIIRIGYLEAGLGVENLVTIFSIDLAIRKRMKIYPISCKIHFDNCTEGVREVSKVTKTSINLF
jgi:hypothetical protein